MRNLYIFILVILAGLLMAACAQDPATSTPVSEPRPTSTPTPSPALEPAVEPTATALPAPGEDAFSEEEEAGPPEEAVEPQFPADSV